VLLGSFCLWCRSAPYDLSAYFQIHDVNGKARVVEIFAHSQEWLCHGESVPVSAELIAWVQIFGWCGRFARRLRGEVCSWQRKYERF
jgi:hypothetical protein